MWWVFWYPFSDYYKTWYSYRSLSLFQHHIRSATPILNNMHKTCFPDINDVLLACREHHGFCIRKLDVTEFLLHCWQQIVHGIKLFIAILEENKKTASMYMAINNSDDGDKNGREMLAQWYDRIKGVLEKCIRICGPDEMDIFRKTFSEACSRMKSYIRTAELCDLIGSSK